MVNKRLSRQRCSGQFQEEASYISYGQQETFKAEIQVVVKKGLCIVPSSQKFKKRSQVEMDKVMLKDWLSRSGTEKRSRSNGGYQVKHCIR
jgi:hypothetical protein